MGIVVYGVLQIHGKIREPVRRKERAGAAVEHFDFRSLHDDPVHPRRLTFAEFDSRADRAEGGSFAGFVRFGFAESVPEHFSFCYLCLSFRSKRFVR